MTSCPRAEILLEHFWNPCVPTLVVENAIGAQQFLDEWKSRSSWQASIPLLHGRNLHITHVEIDTLAVRSFPASALLLSSRVTIFSFNKNQTILSWKEIGFIFNKKSELEAYIYFFLQNVIRAQVKPYTTLLMDERTKLSGKLSGEVKVSLTKPNLFSFPWEPGEAAQ